MTADFALGVQSAVIEGRQLAESLMVDTCTVRYKTGRSAINETTNKEAPVYATRFTSACRVREVRTVTPDSTVGGRREARDETRVDLPVSAPQVFTDDQVVIDAVGPSSDPRLVGRVFVVNAPMNQTFSTATRLTVTEASS